MKYWAGAVGEARHTLAGWARALAFWAWVMTPVSAMASRTRAVRWADRSGSSAGL